MGNLISQSTPYIVGELPALFSILEEQLEKGEIDSVLVLCDQILANESNKRIKGIAYFYKGQAEAYLNRYPLIETYYLNASEIFQAINDKKGMAMVYCKQADFYFYQRNFSTADSLFDLSISYAEKLNLHQVLADAYQKKATIYNYIEDPESAIILLKKVKMPL